MLRKNFMFNAMPGGAMGGGGGMLAGIGAPMARGAAGGRGAPEAVADNAIVGNAKRSKTISAGGKPKLKEVTKVRKEFPESWIWAELESKY